MIQLTAIRIEEFRGIRTLELDLDRNSFVVLGPNGSGKSGVIDAIDFSLASAAPAPAASACSSTGRMCTVGTTRRRRRWR
jgi:recombinational DNA repair ATPase RecF